MVTYISGTYAQTTDIKVACNYTFDDDKWALSGVTGTYLCNVLTDFGKINPKVIEVTGTHINTGALKTNADVEMVAIIGKELIYFPAGFTATTIFGTQLTHFYIDKSSIASITIDDLRPFGATLEYFGITNSKISYLTKDIFTDNTGLELLDFQGNPITFIESDTFKVR